MTWADPDGSDLNDAEFQKLFNEVAREVVRPLESEDGMTPKEAIESAGQYDWVRPVSWRGSGDALCERYGRLVAVPSPHGGDVWHVSPEDLCQDWEVVSAETVSSERYV